ncbi:MAG TPA: hypothetical protein VIF32_02395 [Gemmatimonadaceae bacterium]
MRRPLIKEPPVPVTARLSKLFYDRLGEEIAKELVDWFNQVDATYRSDLRELNELNFARFDAKLEQRFAQMEVKIEQRFAQMDVKIVQLRSELRAELATSRAEMERRLGEQTRWMFLCWATLLASNIALWMR